MKAEERHELQRNDLVGGMAGVYVFIRNYGIYVLFGIAIIVLIVELLQLHKADEQRKVQEAAMALQQAQTPEQIQNTVLNMYHDPAIAAQAYVRIGDFYLNLLTVGNPAKGMGGIKASKAESITGAETAFHAVITKYTKQKLMVARAKLGLALTYEDAGQWSKAAAIYKQFTTPDAGTLDKSFATLAQYRLDHLKKWAQAVLVGPPQTQTAATQSAATTQGTSSPPAKKK